jgi:general secretion pathway protein I
MRTSAVRLAVPNHMPATFTAAAANPARAPRRSSARIRREQGFTLIEIVVAFAILALGLAVAMQIATGAMRNSRRAAERTEAALYAQSLLDSAGVGERLEEGETTGDFGDTYRWTLDVAPFEVEVESENAAPLDPALSPIHLYRLELLVTWGEGRAQQEARFVTLRALTPDPGG